MGDAARTMRPSPNPGGREMVTRQNKDRKAGNQQGSTGTNPVEQSTDVVVLKGDKLDRCSTGHDTYTGAARSAQGGVVHHGARDPARPII